MTAITKIFKSGNSFVITLSKKFMEANDLQKGDYVVIKKIKKIEK